MCAWQSDIYAVVGGNHFSPLQCGRCFRVIEDDVQQIIRDEAA